jgi:hypothetical protein
VCVCVSATASIQPSLLGHSIEDDLPPSRCRVRPAAGSVAAFSIGILQAVALDMNSPTLFAFIAAFLAALLLAGFRTAMFVSWILPLLLRDGSNSNVAQGTARVDVGTVAVVEWGAGLQQHRHGPGPECGHR